MKKFVSLLMTVALLAAMLSVVAVPASAAGETESVNKPEGAEWLVDEGDNHVWYELTENDTGLTLTVGGTGNMRNFEAEWLRPWYNDARNITAVEINSGVTSIGNYAFAECGFLDKVTIPETVVSIGDNAFRSCGFVQTLTIPDSVKNIGEFAFYGCGGLDEVTIPGSVESIGEGAFFDCQPTFVINGQYGSAAEKYARENSVAFKGTGTCSHIFCLVCDSCNKTLTKSDLLNAWGYSTGTGSVLSEGSLTIILCVACLAVGFLVAMFIFKKKKPVLAEGENKDEE